MEKHEHEEHNHSKAHSHDVSEIKGVRLILVMLKYWEAYIQGAFHWFLTRFIILVTDCPLL
jgi:hypothetical protein